jgi:hypothetical protein
MGNFHDNISEDKLCHICATKYNTTDLIHICKCKDCKIDLVRDVSDSTLCDECESKYELCKTCNIKVNINNKHNCICTSCKTNLPFQINFGITSFYCDRCYDKNFYFTSDKTIEPHRTCK